MDLEEIFTSSTKVIKENFSKIAYLVLALTALELVGTWINTHSSPNDQPSPNIIFVIVSTILGSLISYAFIKTILRIKGAADLNLKEAVRYLVVNLLFVLLIIGGLVLLIIPGIYFALKYFFVGIVLIDQKLSIKQAFSQAPKLTEGKKLKLLTFFLINAFITAFITSYFAKLTSQYLASVVSVFWELFFMVVTIQLYYKFKKG